MVENHRMFRKAFVCLLLLCFLCPLLGWASPAAPNITSGKANISIGQYSTIQQLTNKVIIDWQSFGIDTKEMVRFLQRPEWIALNRVTGNDPSIILGQLTSQGRIFLINPNGILFGKGSTVNVGGIVASTLNIQNKDFLDGNFNFLQDPKRALSSVVNQGNIYAPNGGYVVLLAPLVSNEGTIYSRLGEIKLGAGTQASFSSSDSGLVNFVVTADVKGSGNIAMDSKSFTDVVNQVVNNKEVVEAGSVLVNNGKISLKGANGTLINAGLIYIGGIDNISGTDTTNAGNITLASSGSIALHPKSMIQGRSVEVKAGGNLDLRNTNIYYWNFSDNGYARSGDIKLAAGKNIGIKDSSLYTIAWTNKGEAKSGDIIISAKGDINIDKSNVNTQAMSSVSSNVYWWNGNNGNVASADVQSGNTISGNIILSAGKDLKIDKGSEVFTKSWSIASSTAYANNGDARTGNSKSGNSISGNIVVNVGRDLKLHKGSDLFSESSSFARTYASSVNGDGIAGNTISGNASSGNVTLTIGRDADIIDNSALYTRTVTMAACNDPSLNVVSKNAVSGNAVSGNVYLNAKRDIKVDKMSRLFSESNANAMSAAPNDNSKRVANDTPNGNNKSVETVAGDANSGNSTSGSTFSGSSKSGDVTLMAGSDIDIDHGAKVYTRSSSYSVSYADTYADSFARTQQGPGSPNSDSKTSSGNAVSGNAFSGNAYSGSSNSGNVYLDAKRDIKVDHGAKVFNESASRSATYAESIAVSSAQTKQGSGAPKSNSNTTSGNAASNGAISGRSQSGSSVSGYVLLVSDRNVKVDHQSEVYTESSSNSQSSAASRAYSIATTDQGPSNNKSSSNTVSGNASSSDAASYLSWSSSSISGAITVSAGGTIDIDHGSKVYSNSESTSSSTAVSHAISQANINGNSNGNGNGNGNNSNKPLPDNNAVSGNAKSGNASSRNSYSGNSKSGKLTLYAKKDVNVDHDAVVSNNSVSHSYSYANSMAYSIAAVYSGKVKSGTTSGGSAKGGKISTGNVINGAGVTGAEVFSSNSSMDINYNRNRSGNSNTTSYSVNNITDFKDNKKSAGSKYTGKNKKNNNNNSNGKNK